MVVVAPDVPDGGVLGGCWDHFGRDHAAPYQLGWDSTGVAGGPHIIKDKAGNAATDAVTNVTVDNSTH